MSCFYHLLRNLVEMALHLIQLSIESFFKLSIYIHQRELIRPKFRLQSGDIALGDSLAQVPWYFRVNFEVEDTSVLIHPRQEEGLRVLEMCHKYRIINQRNLKGRHMRRQ